MSRSRAEALELLKEYVKENSLFYHCLSVEAAMRSYARKFGENKDEWGITGLLHDFDYERWPKEHPVKGSGILRSLGYSENTINAIMGHSNKTGVKRSTMLSKTLYAVDELTGMIMATAHVRPSGFDGMTPRSVKKNIKKKGFAASISRQDIADGIKDLGVDEDEHIALVIEAMQSIKEKIGF